MNLEELIKQARTALADEVEPYLWNDEALVSYFNEAVQEACERALLIQDMTTPSVCKLEVKAGQSTYKLHASVLQVARATLAGRVLEETSIEDLDASVGGWEDRAGQPNAFIYLQTFGPANPALRLVPTPTQDGQLSLRVYRGALLPLKLQGCQIPEIPARHHHKLVNWVARCAYLRPDADGHDPQRAQLHEGYFANDFGLRPDANVQRKRRDKRPRLVKSNW